jgi:hypothetical protein
VAQMLMMGPPAKLTFGFCSPLPIRLELRMRRAEEERMVRPARSNSHRREEVHMQLEGWGYEEKSDCYYPHINYEVP